MNHGVQPTELLLKRLAVGWFFMQASIGYAVTIRKDEYPVFRSRYVVKQRR